MKKRLILKMFDLNGILRPNIERTLALPKDVCPIDIYQYAGTDVIIGTSCMPEKYYKKDKGGFFLETISIGKTTTQLKGLKDQKREVVFQKVLLDDNGVPYLFRIIRWEKKKK